MIPSSTFGRLATHAQAIELPEKQVAWSEPPTQGRLGNHERKAPVLVVKDRLFISRRLASVDLRA
jgi:hypothetical protein